MLAPAAKATLRVGVGAATRAVTHLLAHKPATTIARTRKRLVKAVTGSLKPHSKEAYVDTGGTGTHLNSAGQITITNENQHQFLHLHKSYLLVECDVLKADNTDADHIALTNNGLFHFFSSLKLTLAGQIVEHVNYPGQVPSILGLATYSPGYSKGCGLAQGWTPDIKVNVAAANTGFAIRPRFLIQSPDPKGSFQCAIPMKHIFGFMEDYTKETYGMRDTLQLIRKDDNDAQFRTNAAGADMATDFVKEQYVGVYNSFYDLFC